MLPILLAAILASVQRVTSIYYGNKKAVYGYINDDWRITPTVTLNLGLRYEYTGEPLASNLQSLNSISNVPGLVTFNSPTAQKTNSCRA